MLLTAAAYGRRVGLRVPDSEVAAVRDWLPHWWIDADVAPERTWDVTAADAESTVRGMELWVAEQAVDLVFVHAGVVAVHGAALLLPGRSFSGKTTLTAALLRAGAEYGSDEYAVLSSDGLVHPYPRPLSLRDETGRPRVAAAEFGAKTFAGPIPIGGVAALKYQRGAGYQATPLSPALAVLRLFDNTVCASSRPEESFETLVTATAGLVRAVEGLRGDAEEAAEHLIALLRPDRTSV